MNSVESSLAEGWVNDSPGPPSTEPSLVFLEHQVPLPKQQADPPPSFYQSTPESTTSSATTRTTTTSTPSSSTTKTTAAAAAAEGRSKRSLPPPQARVAVKRQKKWKFKQPQLLSEAQQRPKNPGVQAIPASPLLQMPHSDSQAANVMDRFVSPCQLPPCHSVTAGPCESLHQMGPPHIYAPSPSPPFNHGPYPHIPFPHSAPYFIKPQHLLSADAMGYHSQPEPGFNPVKFSLHQQPFLAPEQPFSVSQVQTSHCEQQDHSGMMAYPSSFPATSSSFAFPGVTSESANILRAIDQLSQIRHQQQQGGGGSQRATSPTSPHSCHLSPNHDQQFSAPTFSSSSEGSVVTLPHAYLSPRTSSSASESPGDSFSSSSWMRSGSDPDATPDQRPYPIKHSTPSDALGIDTMLSRWDADSSSPSPSPFLSHQTRFP